MRFWNPIVFTRRYVIFRVNGWHACVCKWLISQPSNHLGLAACFCHQVIIINTFLAAPWPLISPLRRCLIKILYDQFHPIFFLFFFFSSFNILLTFFRYIFFGKIVGLEYSWFYMESYFLRIFFKLENNFNFNRLCWCSSSWFLNIISEM